MITQIDEFSNIKSPVHNWEPRFKLTGIMVMIFAFSFVQSLWLLPGLALISGATILASRLPFSFLLGRLKLPGVLLLVLAVILPFFSGSTALFYLGPLSVKKEGCLELLLIVVKFYCILTMGIMLFATTPFHTVIKAVTRMGLPQLLADMAYFSYRYIHELALYLKNTQTALRLRGFKPNRLNNLGVFASVAGTILVRSYEQSDRVYSAMTLRGYGQSASIGYNSRHSASDVVKLASALVISAVIIALEILLT
jgi:cobalt/nickel transport system permease protein